MIEQQKEKYKEFRDKHYEVIVKMFKCLNILLILMTFIMLITGVQFSGNSILQAFGGKVIFSIIYFFLTNLMMAAFGLILVTQSTEQNKLVSNLRIFMFGVSMFFLCMIPMLTTSGAMFSLNKVDTNEIRELCQTDFTVHKEQSPIQQRFTQDKRDEVGPLFVELMDLAHTFDMRSQYLLDHFMCTEFCPCQDDGPQYKDGKRVDPKFLYKNIPKQFLHRHKRQFDSKDGRDMRPFKWTTKDGFYSFKQCIEDWKKNNFLPREGMDLKNDELQEFLVDLTDVIQYQEIEDKFECSGMCRPSLFYFGISINEGYPDETCLMQFKEYLDKHAQSFGYTCQITAILTLLIWLLHFGFYFKYQEEIKFDSLQNMQDHQDSIEMPNPGSPFKKYQHDEPNTATKFNQGCIEKQESEYIDKI